MNDEIKEILHEMKQMCDVWVKVDGNMKSYNQDQIHKIYEYITNLQEELEEEKRINQEDLKLIDELQQRIEKAVEYIKQYGNLYCLKHQQFKKYYQYEELLNILNGRSDE